MIPVLVLFGPTASGKTDVLVKLFGQNGFFPKMAEIISADSMQVYRGMDIGTAKPSQELLSVIPHHLIDIRNPDEQFNTGDFVHCANEAICEIAGRGKIPVVSGGTGFYLKNLIFGLPETPPCNEQIRNELKNELQEKGAAVLLEELSCRDLQSAQKIHINDEYRLLRALEVIRLTGRTLSSYNTSGSGREVTNYKFITIGLFRPREELYKRINKRCAAMFALGLPQEVARLYDAGFSPEDPGLRAIGYKEFFVKDEEGIRLSKDLVGVQSLIAQNSRNYAKRQISFFTSFTDAKKIMASDDDDLTADLIKAEIARLFN